MRLALYGEDSERARQTLSDWRDYVAEMSKDQSRPAVIFHVVRSSLSHIFWRLRWGGEFTTIPASLFLIGVAVISIASPFLVLPSGERVFLPYIHLAIGAVLVAAVILQNPRRLKNCRVLGSSLVVSGTGLIHIGLTIQDGEYGSAVLDWALVASGAALLVASVLCFFENLPLVTPTSSLTVFCYSAAIASLAHLFEAVRAPELGQVAVALTSAMISLFIAVNFWRLRTLVVPAPALT